ELWDGARLVPRGIGPDLRSEGRAEASGLYPAADRRPGARLLVRFPRQEGPAHPVRVVVSGLPPARAGLARSDARVGEAGTSGAAGRHAGAARRPLPPLRPVERVRLADPPRPDQLAAISGRPD